MVFAVAGGASAGPNLSCARGLKPGDIQGIIGKFEASAGAFQDQFEILTVPAGPGRDGEVAGALVGAAMANEMVGTLVSMGPMLALRDDFYPGEQREFVVDRVAELMSVVVARVQRVDGAYKRIEARTTQPGIRREAGAARRLLADVRAIFCTP
jgi:hypothetical protein